MPSIVTSPWTAPFLPCPTMGTFPGPIATAWTRTTASRSSWPSRPSGSTPLEADDAEADDDLETHLPHTGQLSPVSTGMDIPGGAHTRHHHHTTAITTTTGRADDDVCASDRLRLVARPHHGALDLVRLVHRLVEHRVRRPRRRDRPRRRRHAVESATRTTCSHLPKTEPADEDTFRLEDVKEAPPPDARRQQPTPRRPLPSPKIKRPRGPPRKHPLTPRRRRQQGHQGPLQDRLHHLPASARRSATKAKPRCKPLAEPPALVGHAADPARLPNRHELREERGRVRGLSREAALEERQRAGRGRGT